jgi:uncharacterized Zn finger protein (UPF0148 family)
MTDKTKIIDWVCPVCDVKFGTGRIIFESKLTKEKLQFKPEREFKDAVIFTDQGTIICPNCHKDLNQFEIYVMITLQLHPEAKEDWKKYRKAVTSNTRVK